MESILQNMGLYNVGIIHWEEERGVSPQCFIKVRECCWRVRVLRMSNDDDQGVGLFFVESGDTTLRMRTGTKEYMRIVEGVVKMLLSGDRRNRGIGYIAIVNIVRRRPDRVDTNVSALQTNAYQGWEKEFFSRTTQPQP